MSCAYAKKICSVVSLVQALGYWWHWQKWLGARLLVGGNIFEKDSVGYFHCYFSALN
jgi:hypothetical protein